MPAEGDAFVAEAPVPAHGGIAWFAEAEFTGDAGGYMLSTPPRITAGDGKAEGSKQ
jgi:hypothetical protein